MKWTPGISMNFAGSPRATDRGSAAQRRAQRFFRLNCLLGASALLAAGTVVAGGLDSVSLTSSTGAERVTLLGQAFSHPSVNAAAAALLALLVVAGVVLTIGARAAAGAALASRRFGRAIEARCVRRERDFLVFADDDVHAFCAGLLRPRIYISTGALNVLSSDEVNAVLAHERHHRRRRDPLRIAMGRVSARALFFLPVAGMVHGRYCAMAELAADDSAAGSQAGGSRALASALLAFARRGRPTEAVGIAPERVEHMLGQQPDWPLPTRVVGAVLAVSALTTGCVVVLAQAASTRASLALPFLSTRPCLAIIALPVAGLAWWAAARVRGYRLAAQSARSRL